MKTLSNALSVLFFISQLVFSQVPQTTSFQGVLTDAEGVVVVDGDYSLTFKLYDSATNGTMLWEETQAVATSGGLFSVILGSVNPLNLSFDNGYWLEMSVDGGEALSPRVELTSSFYSLVSKTVEDSTISTVKLQDNSVTTAKLADGVITQDKLSPSVSIPPGGTAGGDLVGSYPNPTIAENAITSAEVVDNTITSEDIATNVLSSIDGVYNDGGDVDLVGGSNITITADNEANTITIAADGVGGGDVTSVGAGEGLTGGGSSGDVSLNVVGGNGILVTADEVALNTSYTDGRYVNSEELNSITSSMVADNSLSNADISTNLLSSIDGVVNDGGNVDLIGGSNITITPDDGANTITIAAASSGDNLGNHTATQNIRLNGNYLSGDGGSEGLFVSNTGNVGIGVNNPASSLSIGNEGDGFFRVFAVGDYAGLYGEASNPNITVTTYGGLFKAAGTSGRAVVGYATNSGSAVSNYGGYFTASGEYGKGIYGKADGGLGVGVSGEATSTYGYGVFGLSQGAMGRGVYGYASNTENNYSYGGYFRASSVYGTGVYAYATGAEGRGVRGWATNSGDVLNIGGYFSSSGASGYGVYAYTEGANGLGIYGAHIGSGNIGVLGSRIDGVQGWSNSSSGSGVAGIHNGTGKGIYGRSASGYAGWFDGAVHVNGTFSKSAGSFKIDHPLDPENKYLYHSFVESPDMKNIYDGNVTTDANGNVEVTLPEWFEALNKDFRYQLTVIGEFAQAIVYKKITNNRFSIKTDKPNVEVSWQVTGIRHDSYAIANRIPVEEVKQTEDRGKYLNPEVFGLTVTKGVSYSEDYEQERIRLDEQHKVMKRMMVKEDKRMEEERMRMEQESERIRLEDKPFGNKKYMIEN